MVEDVLRDYLASRLDAPVITELKPNLKRYVLLERTGHYIDNYVHHATVVIRSVDESQYKAALLDEQVMEAMEIARMENIVDGCDLENNFNDTDDRIKGYRYRSEYLVTW